MAAVRGKNTYPELAVRRYLHGAGLRFVLHDTRLPGSPDIVLPRHRAAVFVNGCFWHRHGGCRLATVPASHTNYWSEKFARNVLRDKKNEDDGLGMPSAE
jgi:DNA mismatch endonuclease, patch repair protein